MWTARTKEDLIIEVWEKLDCESVGRSEVEAIATAVEAHFGKSAVESPMVIARLLAEEGAYLRHSEIMELFVARASERPYDAVFRNVVRLGDLRSALATIGELENIRKKFSSAGDRDGLRELRETALRGKSDVSQVATSPKSAETERQIAIEVTQWLSLWLQTPELFDDWVELRQNSPGFIETFGRIKKD